MVFINIKNLLFDSLLDTVFDIKTTGCPLSDGYNGPQINSSKYNFAAGHGNNLHCGTRP